MDETMSRSCFAAMAGALALALLPSVPRAQITKTFEFDGPGLPSLDPDILYCPGGGALDEGVAFDAPGDGLLHQDLQGHMTAHLYSFKQCDNLDGTIDPALSFSLEARIQCSSIVGEGAVLQVANGLWGYKIVLTESGELRVFHPQGSQDIPVDPTQPHSFRIESPANSPVMRVYVDGCLVTTTMALDYPFNFFHWGGGAQSPPSSSSCDWDYVRFSQPSSPSPTDCSPPSGPCQVGRLVGEGLDGFGRIVALSGDVALIGAPVDDELGLDAGAAYVHRFDGLHWIREQKLVAPDGSAGDLFGWWVSVDGGVAVIGARGHDEGRGKVYVYRYSDGTWELEQELVPMGLAAGDRVGESVSVWGDTLVVGALGSGSSDAGAAYVYRFGDSTSKWQLEETLTASDAEANDHYGRSVAVHGGLIAVGATQDDSSGTRTGRAYVYRYNPAGSPKLAGRGQIGRGALGDAGPPGVVRDERGHLGGRRGRGRQRIPCGRDRRRWGGVRLPLQRLGLEPRGDPHGCRGVGGRPTGRGCLDLRRCRRRRLAPRGQGLRLPL
jgi:hypothetical protein